MIVLGERTLAIVLPCLDTWRFLNGAKKTDALGMRTLYNNTFNYSNNSRVKLNERFELSTIFIAILLYQNNSFGSQNIDFVVIKAVRDA